MMSKSLSYAVCYTLLFLHYKRPLYYLQNQFPSTRCIFLSQKSLNKIADDRYHAYSLPISLCSLRMINIEK